MSAQEFRDVNLVKPGRPKLIEHAWQALNLGGCLFWGLRIQSYVPAKSLQSYLTLCDPIDCSPPGSSIHGIFQARVLKWVAIAFSRLLSSMWNLPRPRISYVSPTLASGFLTTEPPGKFQEKRQFKHWLMFVFLALAGQRSVSAPAQPVLCHCPTFLVPRKHVVGGV